MRKILYFLSIIFLLLLFTSPNVAAQEGAECDVLHFGDGLGWTCTNLDEYDCEDAGGTYQPCVEGYSGDYTQGSCCEPPYIVGVVRECAHDEYCLPVPEYVCTDPTSGGKKRYCQPDIPADKVGCCFANLPDPEPYECGDDYDCTELFEGEDSCLSFTGPVPCGPDGHKGCCIPKEIPEPEICDPGFGCQTTCRVGSAGFADYEENCLEFGEAGCCVAGELDEGQVDCKDLYGDEFGCVNRECTEEGKNIGAEYSADCGHLGATGCCSSGAEDEEFWPETPEIPDDYKYPEEKDYPNIFAEILDKLNTSEEELAAETYNVLMPIGVAIGIISIILAGYMFMTSQGNPDKVNAAKERLTAAIAGTLFIVLSLVILKVIINTLF